MESGGGAVGRSKQKSVLRGWGGGGWVRKILVAESTYEKRLLHKL